MVTKPEYPPNIKDIARVIKDVMKLKYVVFTYGNIIFNPFNRQIDECVGLHEAQHSLQQDAVGGPKIWWKRWLYEPHFRMEQELEGYGVQYRRYCELNKDRNARFSYLYQLAHDLSSPQYGSVITLVEARRRIAAYV